MIYWQRFVGDWKKKTAHLSAAEKGVYGELLDHYYSTEARLPLDKEALYRLAGAQNDTEQKAVDSVLRQFFKRTEEGYSNSTAEQHLDERRRYIDGQKRSANARWHKEGSGNGAWWRSDDGINAKGRELGLAASPGEAYPEYKQRLFAEIARRKQAS